MGAVQVAVGVDHFGLNPQPEFHPQRVHPRRQRGQPAGVFDRISGPIAQSGTVIAAALEPTIVEDEAFYADCCGSFSQSTDPRFVVIEIASFP